MLGYRCFLCAMVTVPMDLLTKRSLWCSPGCRREYYQWATDQRKPKKKRIAATSP